MTTTTIQRPETIRLADALKRRTPFLDGSSTIDHAEKELRRQHAEIELLKAAYIGAQEDIAIWKRRALEAEEKLRAESAVSSRLVSDLNAENGPMHMGEPVQQRQSLTDVEKHAMWVMATIDQCSHEQCYLRGIADSEAAHGIVEKP